MAAARFLIVEDDVTWQAEPLADVIRDEGHEVVGIAANVAEAKDLAGRYRPDVILMDVGIPLTDTDGELPNEEGGLIAAGEIRRVSPDTIIIWITGQAISAELLQRLHSLDATAPFVTKPRNQDELRSAVQLMLLKRAKSPIVFLSHAHRDTAFKDEMLLNLPTSGVGVDVWHDGRVQYGDQWKIAIHGALRRADVAVLLVSTNFINSSLVRNLDLTGLLEAQVRQNLRVIPVFVGPVPPDLLERSKLDRFQGLNRPDDPLSAWPRAKRDLNAWGVLSRMLTQRSGSAGDSSPGD